MKLINHFNNFLIDTVNLNQTRINRLNGHVEAIERFLRQSDYKPKIRWFSAQGSWAHKTIIKPIKDHEFDVDLVMFVDPENEWMPKDYVEELYKIFIKSGTYKDKAGRNTRCVTLDYAGDFHLDVVPCVIRENLFADDEYDVCNRKDDVFEPTNPEGYTEWLFTRNDWSGNNTLRKVTRLIKYIRDIKGGFSVKSILLTTLLGREVNFLDSLLQSTYFPDVPTALKTLIGRLDDFLQANPEMPVIENPVLKTENFNRHWDQKKYENFRSKIHQYREWVDDAYGEPDRDESIRKWRKVFGEEFAKGEVVKKAASVRSFVAMPGYNSDDVVTIVRNFGVAVLNRIPSALPHVQAPIWKAANNNISVLILAEEYDKRDGTKLRSLTSGEVLRANRWLKFKAMQASGLNFPATDYFVSWRVVNTDQEAANADQLRGDFYRSHTSAVRWEETRFHGAHWVEAFLISKRTQHYVGKSDRFFVVIE